MAYTNGKEMNDYNLPNILFSDSDLLSGLALDLKKSFGVSVKSGELYHNGEKVLHINQAIELPSDVAYESALRGAIIEYLNVNRGRVPPSIVVYKIRGKEITMVNPEVIGPRQLPVDVTDLIKLRADLKGIKKFPDGTLKYEAEGDSIPNSRMVKRSLIFVSLKDYMHLLTNEQLEKFVKDPLYDRTRY